MTTRAHSNVSRSPGQPGSSVFARRRVVVIFLCLLLGVTAAGGAQAEDELGLQLSFDELLDRKEALLLGTRVAINADLHVRQDWLKDPIEAQYRYSPELQTVYRISGPAFLAEEPNYYLYDGAWYVYEPRSWTIPGIELRATPRMEDQHQKLQLARRELFEKRRARDLGFVGGQESNRGFEIKVLPVLPGALQGVFGNEETNIRVTGRESISFAGESRRVSPFIRNEQGRGQSLFPRLDMDQDLQVKLDGTIGGKVNVVVDHNSSGFGADANRINIWYEGYEDDIVRRIDMGSTNLSIPGSRLVSFAGGSQGLFGVKTDLRIGGLDLTLVASKQETETETRSLTPSGASAAPSSVPENRYVRDQFFFYVQPDINNLFDYDSYGLNPGRGTDDMFTYGDLIDQSQVQGFRVFVDEQDPNSIDHTFQGFAVEGLPSSAPEDKPAAWTSYENNPNTARWPESATGAPESLVVTDGRWRELRSDEIGYVLYSIGVRKVVLGFYMKFGPLRSDVAVGVTYENPQNADLAFGSVDETFAEGKPTVRLRLVRHPDQEISYDDYPTSSYMMRHVYNLGARSITQLEVGLLSQASGKQAREIPDNIPATTYLHMFGLDEFDQENQPIPDGQFDLNRANLVDFENGFLFLPGLRPFSPPDEVLQGRLDRVENDGSGLDMLFTDTERVPSTLYTLPKGDPSIPNGKYTLQVRVTAGEREIILPQDIVEGSEVVTLDGRVLTSGVDYDIEPFAGGRITLKGEALTEINPESRIEVSYQFRPLFGGGQASLFGASAKYKLGNRGQLASVWLFESRRGLTKRPRLGEEPNRTLVGDVNGSIRFQPRWMTKLMDILPFTNTSAASNLQFNGEVAISLPNPNTKGSAFIDDLENAADDDEFPLSRRSWYWASIPPEGPGESASRSTDSLRVPMFWYNPVGRVRRGDLNPLLDSREADDGLSVLEIGFDRDYASELIPVGHQQSDRWSGIMTTFGTTGLDLTQAKSLQFWLNDARAFADRRGKIHFDFGSVSEDFVFFENLDASLSNPRFNREAETEQNFFAQDDDLGFNGVLDNCEIYDDGSPETNFPPEGADCHIPSKIDVPTQQFPFANGTEGNNQYDTEDINGNGRFDETESFFRYSMDLSDVTWVETDVQRDYGSLNLGVTPENAWRQYRIDFGAIQSELETITRLGASQPSLRQIRYMRVWFDDPEATDGSFFNNNVQIYGFKFTGNQWLQLGVFAVDSTSVLPASDETYTVSTINNKEDPIYVPPPVDLQLDAGGIQAREQSLRMTFNNLRSGHEMVLQRTLNLGGRSMDITTYRRLKYFVHYPALSDSIEFFFRLGTDSLNFYEIAHTTPAGASWTEINIDMDRLTELRFPEDVPGATFERININGALIQQIKAPTVDAAQPSRQLLLTRRGEPSLKSLTRLFIGVRHLNKQLDSQDRDAVPVSGDLWFNEVSVDEVDREMGMAQAYSVTGKFADVLDTSVSYSVTDPEFRGLRQRLGSGSENVSFSNRYSGDISRLVPTWGFSIPANYSFSKSRVRPKWFSSGDTRNTEAQKDEQRSESVRQTMGVSVSKRASRFFLWKPTLDKLRFSYSRSETEARSFTSRDTTVAWTQTLTYDISPRARAFRIWRQHKINLFPTNIKFNVQNQQSFSTRYTVRKILNLETGALEDTLTQLASSPNRQLTWSGSTALRPLPNVTARYSFNESRNYRAAHESNEAERFKVFDFDFGIPIRRSENFAFDLTPKLFRFGYASSYSDGRISSNNIDGDPLPDTHNLTNRRTRRLSFDVGMHRKIAAWGIFQDKPEAPQPPSPVAASQDPNAATNPNEATDPNNPLDVAPAPGAADSVETAPTKGRRPPNPLKFVFRTIGRIEPVRVELTDGLSTSYTGLSSEAQALYRLGWTTDTGVTNGSVPTPVDRNNSVELSTGMPLFGTVKLTTRYARRWSERESRSEAGGIRIKRNPTLETTFPSLQISISNLHKLPLFRSKMRRSTLSLGMNQIKTSSSNQTFDEDNIELSTTNESSSERLNGSANWTAQWGGDVATTFSINRASNESKRVGSATSNVTWRLQSSVRFKIEPQGGLKLPLFGTLRGGMDVSVSANYNRDENRLFNNPNDPSDFIVTRRGNAWSLSTRGDYTLSRNMSGGMEVSFSRTGQNDTINRTTSVLRLGFNLTFVF